MTKILIKQCPDTMRWYRDKVGQLVDYVPRYDSVEEFGSREPAGYINFVMRRDAELIKVEDEK